MLLAWASFKPSLQILAPRTCPRHRALIPETDRADRRQPPLGDAGGRVARDDLLQQMMQSSSRRWHGKQHSEHRSVTSTGAGLLTISGGR